MLCVGTDSNKEILTKDNIIVFFIYDPLVINLKTNISNNKINHSINGNTNTVYVNPINALKFVLNKLKNDKVKLNKNFYVFTGSTVGVVPILRKGFYTGKIEKFGSVKTKII